MNPKKKKSSQNEPELKYLFEKKVLPSPIQIHSSIGDMGLTFDAEICQSVKPKITLDSPEPWPVNSIPSAWYESYDDHCLQSPIQIHSSLEDMGLAINTEICRSINSAIIFDSSEAWPANSFPSAWYESSNDNC